MFKCCVKSEKPSQTVRPGMRNKTSTLEKGGECASLTIFVADCLKKKKKMGKSFIMKRKMFFEKNVKSLKRGGIDMFIR